MLLAFIGCSCAIGPLDSVDKVCPCADDFICDPCENRCVPRGKSTNCAWTDDPEAAVQVGVLTVEWATPNQARWSWSLGKNNVPDQFVGYQLTIAQTEEDLLGLTGTARTVTAAENPELGRYALPRASGDEVVTGTIVNDLLPDTVYQARLVAIDSIGRRSVSNVASVRTQDPAVLGMATIYSEVLDVGHPLPAEFMQSDTDSFAGSSCYRWQQQDGCGACWENLRMAGIDVDLSAVTPGAFANSAYLEFSVALQAETSSYWSEVRLWLKDDQAQQVLATFAPITYPAVGDGVVYRTYQLPLRAFDDEGTALTGDHILTLPLHEVGIGGSWDDGAVVRVDEVRIFW